MIATITAGGRVEGELAKAMGTTVKALSPLGHTTPLEAAVSGARTAGARRVVVIGGDEVRARIGHLVDAVIDESPSGRENIARAVATSEDQPLLLLASDMPFLTGEGLRAFVERARSSDVALPIADAASYERTYPGAPPHATKLGRERIVNGSVVYFGAGIAPRVLEISERLFAARKSLLRMAVLLGPTLLLRFVAGQLRIEHVEARATQIFGIRARAIRESDPGLCYDIDGLADRLRAAGRAVFGPGADGARLEGSKAWMKELLDEAGVPTARHRAFSEVAPALAYLRNRGLSDQTIERFGLGCLPAFKSSAIWISSAT